MAKSLGMTLPIRLGANGYFQTTTDVLTQVKTDLTNLLLTRRGERMFQPNFGCDLPLILFEPATDDGLAEATSVIQTAVQTWLPFVRVNAVKISRDDVYNRVTIAVSFTLLTNNVTDSIILVF